MARFDRFTKALALGHYREAFMSVIHSAISTCFDHRCPHNSCPARCICGGPETEFYCVPVG